MTSRQTRLATACQQLLALAAVVALLLPAANVVSLDVIGDAPYAAPDTSQSDVGGAGGVPAGSEPMSTAPAAKQVREAAKVSASEPATDAAQSSTVAAAPVDSAVTEYDLTDKTGEPTPSPAPSAARRPAGVQPEAPSEPTASATPSAPAAQDEQNAAAQSEPAGASAEKLSDGRTQLTAAPQAVSDFGTVGVTWDNNQEVADDAITVQVRTNTNGAWSQWSDLEYHDEHGPDAGTAEARNVRPGTDPMVIGRVDEVQVRTQTQGTAPSGLRMAVVEANDAEAPTAVESPAIDTAELPVPESAHNADDAQPSAQGDATASDTSGSDGAIALQAAVINKAKQPVIYSRAQWGANEKIRDSSSLRYGTIKGGFVHHTVNGNSYTKDEVPGILRSIYSYHVKSRGWSDIGYNFLIDRFGRIWEGRYGGVTKAVVGAHTLNYNDYSFAASAIGNFETAKPTEAMVNAYASLLAWKLGANGVSAAAGKTKIGRTTFAHSINGHRDAASTACPGRYLYARIGDIRSRAAALQAGSSNSGNTNGGNTGNGGNSNSGNTGGNGTNLGNSAWTGASYRTSLTNRTYPDLVVVRASDKRAMVLPTGGMTNFAAPRTLSKGWASMRSVQIAGDLTGDKRADILFITGKGVLRVRKGKGNGAFGGSVKAIKDFSAFQSPRAAGDLNGDGRGDMIAWHKKNKRVYVFLGTGRGTFGAGKSLSSTTAQYKTVYPAGDLTGDGKVDLLGLKGGKLYLHPGQGNGKFTPARLVAGSWGSYVDFAAGTDFTNDGKADLVARDRAGKLSVFPGKGNGTFGAAYGPTTRAVPALNGISSAGNLVNGAGADLVGRQGDALVAVPNADTYELGSPVDTGRTLPSANVVVAAGDWDRDGKGDMLTRSASSGALYIWRGIGGGKLSSGVKIATGFANFKNLTVIGDVTGDGYPDLVATGPSGNSFVYPGNGLKGLKARLAAPTGAIMKLPVNTSAYDWVVPVANLTRASTRADVVVRERSTGRLYVLEGAANYATRRLLSESVAGYTLP